jgi:hypothetical protein
MWGGHSCPPLLNLISLLVVSANRRLSKIKVKGDGQECPSHIDNEGDR